jgi:hypothetical protein
MDVLTMVLIERGTGIPLDLVILINKFLYEKITDENFQQAIYLWCDDFQGAHLDSVTLVSGIPQELQR